MAYIKDLAQFVGKTVTLKGWVYNFRSSGSIAFWQLRDGSGFTQVIIEKTSVPDAVWEESKKVTLETSVTVEGTVHEHPKHKGEYEVHATGANIVHRAEEYPIGKKEHGPDFLMDFRHLWIRSPKQEAILRVRSEVVFAIQEFFRTEGFTLTHTPTFTPNACEGTTDLFEVKYFDEVAYLTQNGQLYLEALAMALGRVYDINPNFRAEKSKTRKHLTEFWTCNPEMAFTEHVESLAIQERMVAYVVGYALKHCTAELALLERDITKLQPAAQGNFPRLTYNEAVAKLQTKGSPIKYGEDFGAAEEAMLSEDYDRPVFIINWPKSLKPFYVKGHPDDKTLVLNADLIAPDAFGEIIGGSQREDDYETLKNNILAHKLPLDVFEWYLDLRRYGSVPHCGFGLGIERTVRWITGVEHIRETIPFPRTIYRLKP